MNIEKVIKGLEVCTAKPCYCTDCPYKKECCLDSQQLMEDALALLKRQEAVKPVRDEHDNFCCGRCGKRIAWAIKIFDGYSFVTTHPDHLKPESKCNFCKHCGQAVKWE